jgi:hypothetical protein
MAKDPAALQLRLLQTVVEVAGEKNSTLVMPVPVELLRFFEKMAPAQAAPSTPPEELEDLGDEEVAAAEAAISHAPQPAIGDTKEPSVPELGAGENAGADLADGTGTAGAAGEEVPVTER